MRSGKVHEEEAASGSEDAPTLREHSLRRFVELMGGERAAGLSSLLQSQRDCAMEMLERLQVRGGGVPGRRCQPDGFGANWAQRPHGRAEAHAAAAAPQRGPTKLDTSPCAPGVAPQLHKRRHHEFHRTRVLRTARALVDALTASKALTNAESLYSETRTRVEAVRAELADVRRRTEDLQREAREIATARGRAEATQSEASTRLGRAKRELSALSERRKTLEGAIADYGGLVAEHKRRIGALRNQLAELQRGAEEQKRAEKEATDQVSALRRHAREQAGAADAAHAQVQRARGELGREQERLAVCREEEEGLRRAAAEARATREQSAEAAAALRAEEAALGAAAQAAAEETAALRRRLAQARAEVKRLRNERATAREGASAAAAEAGALRREAEEAREEAAAQARRGAEASAALAAATSARDRAATAAAEAEAQLRRAEEARAADGARLQAARQALAAAWGAGGNEKDVTRIESLTKVAQALEARRCELEQQGTCRGGWPGARTHPMATTPAWNVARLGALQRAMALLAKAGLSGHGSTSAEKSSEGLRQASKHVRPGGGAPSPEADATQELGATRGRRRRAVERGHAEGPARRRRRQLRRQPRPCPRPALREVDLDADELDLFADV